MPLYSTKSHFYIESDESEHEILDFKLFDGYIFSIVGLQNESKANIYKILKLYGAKCDDETADYTFTDIRYYNSQVKGTINNNKDYYNITFVRDCVDANEFLNLAKYKFGLGKVKNSIRYFDSKFEPCCAIYHRTRKSCSYCDGTRVRPIGNVRSDKTKPINNESKARTSMNSSGNIPRKSVEMKVRARKKFLVPIPFSTEDKQRIIDYLITNTNLDNVKGTTVYQRMIDEGYIINRSAEGLRKLFRIDILKNIEQYDISPEHLAKFKKIRAMGRCKTLLKLSSNHKAVKPFNFAKYKTFKYGHGMNTGRHQHFQRRANLNVNNAQS